MRESRQSTLGGDPRPRKGRFHRKAEHSRPARFGVCSRVLIVRTLGVGVERMTRRPTAIVERERDGYVALCSEVDVASQGDSVTEARRDLEEALALFFEMAAQEGIEGSRGREAARCWMAVQIRALDNPTRTADQ